MALPSARYEYRLSLNNLDRKVELTQSLVAARHPSETAEHLTLRVLAWCLLYQEGIAFGPNISDPDNADVWGHDLTGQVTLWVECGATSADKLRKIVQHNSDAAVHVVFGDERRQQELFSELGERGRLAKGLSRVEVWSIDETLLQQLARNEARRQQWTVTVVGDHFYIDADGQPVDGAVRRGSLPES
jgi:uncharacterized protein YaeQ